MASYVYPTPEVYKSVTRPVAMQIIRNMFTITGIDPKVFRSKMIGMVESEKVPGSAIDDKAPNDEQLQNRLSSDKKFSMEIEEEFLGDLVTAVKRPNNHPVFYDPALKLSIKPVRLQVKTKISVIVNFMDKVSANNWLRQIKAQILQTGLTHYHTIDYHYPLPRNIVAQLMHMHKLRENVDGYGESFGQWCRRCFVKTYDIITNEAGQGKQFVIREKQTNIYGWFDFDFVPTKAEKESDRAGGWNIQFDYYFYYDRPDNLVISFPLMVHNQLISQEYFNPERPLNRDSYRSFSSITDEAYDRIVATVNTHSYTRRPGIPAPIFDDWNCGQDPKGFVQFSRTLLSLDPADKKWLVNLDELSADYSLKPIILDFINKSGNSVFKTYDSIFNIVLYRWDSLLGPEHLNLVKPNKIVTPLDLSLRDMYHIVIYLLVDLSLLSDKGWDDLLNDCKVFHEYAEMLFPGTGVEKIRCNSDNTVNRDDFDEWWNNIKDDTSDFTNPGGGPGNGGPGGYNPYDPQWGKNNDYKTIGFFGIQAKRKGEK